ncbi:hypothetical protein [Dyadobacter frigoris]|uniref:Uncharacterized protein n=1 Tax=Dyadobacter frigoris TaxID=2576211 RepID=A0A4V6Y1Y6_9BACT|nr:hypothetical protein [Dyadobacter frigoris]TKT91403.1 hypothetical protein FDK13_13590 [Dyadobacter frigoris]
MTEINVLLNIALQTVAAVTKEVVPLVVKQLRQVIVDYYKNNPDPFINYNVLELNDHYILDKRIGFHNGKTFIPYEEIANWVDSINNPIQNMKISINPDPFSLAKGSHEWEQLSKQGFDALFAKKRFKANEPIIRLCEVSANATSITIQQSHYHDQAFSNLVLDYHPDPNNQHEPTLRKILDKEYARKLPPFSETRLANTIGIATLVFYQESGKLVPYFVKRVEKIGVFPKAIHCTSSGAARWPDTNVEVNFENYFMNHMYSELEEEVGIVKNNILELKPVAFCRELARGGKPQLFFAAVTNLSRNQLYQQRASAIKMVDTSNGGWLELEKGGILNKNDVVIAKDKLEDRIKSSGLTHEAIGSAFYGLKYIDKNKNEIAEYLKLKI